ncbi:unnamed protein product [Fraxinus pennsylvanica]|uniref:Uncharacterized protein n=2 Tax=lamiids TaxID=91888 RepID=A0AAD1Z7K0_9LAMI|nr:unnamed protein product [Fraxinus pennsylvanica]
MLHPRDTYEVFQIQLVGGQNRPDVMNWEPEKNGFYTVRSGYRLFVKNNGSRQLDEVSYAEDQQKMNQFIFEHKIFTPQMAIDHALIVAGGFKCAQKQKQYGTEMGLWDATRKMIFSVSKPEKGSMDPIEAELLAMLREMALGGGGPQRGTAAAAAANMRRRRTTGGGAAGGASGTMLQFYTDDAPGLKISPNVVLVMSIGFIAFVAILHVMGKLYFVRREA